MARRRRRQAKKTVLIGAILISAVVLAWWWFFTQGGRDAGASRQVAYGSKPVLTSDRPEVLAAPNPHPEVEEKGASKSGSPADQPAESIRERIESLIVAGKQAIDRGDPVAARSHFSEAMSLGPAEDRAALLRAELTRLGKETILSPRIHKDDPLVARYVIQAGDSLAKIAAANKVSDDLLARINGISDKNRIRAGRAIKVIKGPFRAEVIKAKFMLDVYIGDTFISHCKVGLGVDDSTPSGEWRVVNKLKNPTYYPPRGGAIISADDPKNPLGERWIGLAGVTGEAAGQERYGIHGTIEPESIGKATSMGCIRLYNEDVEEFYTLVVEKHSTVTVR